MKKLSTEEALAKERALGDRVIEEFPFAVHSDYVMGHDRLPPDDTIVLCDGSKIGCVVAFKRGIDGWVISVFQEPERDFIEQPLLLYRGHVIVS